jgi:hypothetical protein
MIFRSARNGLSPVAILPVMVGWTSFMNHGLTSKVKRTSPRCVDRSATPPAPATVRNDPWNGQTTLRVTSFLERTHALQQASPDVPCQAGQARRNAALPNSCSHYARTHLRNSKLLLATNACLNIRRERFRRLRFDRLAARAEWKIPRSNPANRNDDER